MILFRSFKDLDFNYNAIQVLTLTVMIAIVTKFIISLVLQAFC